jgi:hypothetical protein
MLDGIPHFNDNNVQGYRLVDSKFPPISIFEDVADKDEFDALFLLQGLTNPRLHAEAGDISFIDTSEIPFGITGCSYATAPFTHVNPDGSRFSDGLYGLLYIADSNEAALAEVSYHREKFCRDIEGLKFEEFTYRELVCRFSIERGGDVCGFGLADAIHSADDYTVSRQLGAAIKKDGSFDSLAYLSVRNEGSRCWALFTPKHVQSIIQARHIQMVWNGTHLSKPVEVLGV